MIPAILFGLFLAVAPAGFALMLYRREIVQAVAKWCMVWDAGWAAQAEAEARAVKQKVELV